MSDTAGGTDTAGATHVALLVDGRYLALGGGADRRLRPGGRILEPAGVFERLELGHGRVALRTLDGRYLATRPDPGLSFGVYPEDELTPAAAFEEVLWPDGRVSLRSCHLTYVGARSTAPVSVNRTEAGPGERLRVVPVATIPPQRQSSTPRATSASPSASAWRSDRMINGTA